MKLLLFLLFTFITTACFGQNNAKFYHLLSQENINNRMFELKAKFAGMEETKSMSIGSQGARKCILSIDGKGSIIVDFWSITDTLDIEDSTIVNCNTSTLSFTLTDNRKKVGDPTNVIKVPFRARTWNVSTTPLRYRFKTDSSQSLISTALSLSFSWGYTWGRSTITTRAMNNYSFTAAIFGGVSTGELKAETVKTPKIWKNNEMLTKTNLVLSYGVNGIFARNNFGVVLSFGLDRMVGEDSRLWSFQNKPWIGLGLNASLGILK